jgi:hypothetical protein
MVLIISNQKMSQTRLAEIAKATFTKRESDTYPASFSIPPEGVFAFQSLFFE